jgi:hypothetical protein
VGKFLSTAIAWYYARTIPSRLAAGDLCSIISEDEFAVVKVLALDRDVVHVRIYKEKFPQRPASINPAGLSLGSIDDPGGFGVGHLPLSYGTFGSWIPIRIQGDSVTDDELVWVLEWHKSKGGVWH